MRLSGLGGTCLRSDTAAPVYHFATGAARSAWMRCGALQTIARQRSRASSRERPARAVPRECSEPDEGPRQARRLQSAGVQAARYPTAPQPLACDRSAARVVQRVRREAGVSSVHTARRGTYRDGGETAQAGRGPLVE